MVWSTDAADVLDISFPMNSVVIDQLALNFFDIYRDNTLQISFKSLLYFARIDDTAKGGLTQF